MPLVALFAFGVTLISLPKGSEATPLGAPTLSLTVVPANGSTVVTAMYTDDTPAGSGSAVLSAYPAIGSFLRRRHASARLTAKMVTVAGATVTVTEDADTLATPENDHATFQCTQPGLTTFTLSHGGSSSTPSVSLICGDTLGGQYPGYPGYPGYARWLLPSYPTDTTDIQHCRVSYGLRLSGEHDLHQPFDD